MARRGGSSGKMRVMNNDVWIIRESVVKITQMLTGQGLKVTQRGITAKVETDKTGKPVAVNLPYIPDNATPELCQAIQGFLDKEVSSVLFTDFVAMKKIERNKELHAMAKKIEDTRVEKEMGKRFRGSASNLANTSQFFLDKYTTPKLNEAIAGANEAEAQAILMHPLIRMMAGLNVETDFMKTKMSTVEEVYNKIKKFGPAIEACASTEQAIELAKAVRKAISEEDEDEDDGEGEGEGEGGMSLGAGAGGEGEGEGEEGESEGDDDGEGAGSGGKSGGGAKEIKNQNSSMCLDDLDKENANDYDKELSALITGDTAATAKHAEYLVYTRDNDVIENLHVGSGYRHSMFKDDIEAKTEHMVGPLQKDLERAISARSLASWENGRRSGKLHSANLARLATNDGRVFRKKHETRSKDVAVSLVIDMSGSMHGGKILLATQAAYALASVLERLRISHEVICFTTGKPVADESLIRAEEAKMGRRYTRNETLYMPILKNYGERFGVDVRSRFGWLPNTSTMRNNVDGESVEIAARRLLSRPENGKVMIVLSDGYPAASGDSGKLNDHLKEVVKESMRAGINVVGIGIQSDSVKSFYPKSVVINNVDELPKTVIQELRHLLIQ